MRVVKVEDGWRKRDTSENYAGNPCDALEVTGLTKGIETVHKERGFAQKSGSDDN